MQCGLVFFFINMVIKNPEGWMVLDMGFGLNGG
jgi:hypothetical protein